MRLHKTPAKDPNLGVQQIHVQLKILCLEMQILKQNEDRTALPEMCDEVWCVKCKGQGHNKDHCLVFVNYLARGGPIVIKT